MKKILIFGGTTDGRFLAESLCNHKDITLVVATEYGRNIVLIHENLKILSQRMTEEEMADLIKNEDFQMVIDATHPYATIVSANIKSATDTTCTKLYTLTRKYSEYSEFEGLSLSRASFSPFEQDILTFPNIDESIKFLNTTKGNILVATGAKELEKFTKITDYKDRLFIRIIPMVDSLEKVYSLGLKCSNIMCMQGPFSEDINVSLMETWNIKYLITKNSGDMGGFSEKISACRKTGAKPVVISRPISKKETDVTFKEILNICLKDEKGTNVLSFSTNAGSSQSAPCHKPSLLLGNTTELYAHTTSDNYNLRFYDEEYAKNKFPIFTSLLSKKIVVVGGGKIALRRVLILLKFGAEITVVSPLIVKELEELYQNEYIHYVKECYDPIYIKKAFMVIAATNDREINKQIGILARERNIFVSVADRRDECNFWFPAITESDAYIAGIISKNGNHRGVKELKAKVRSVLNHEENY